MIDKGFVRPPRDLQRLHAALRERGVARAFSDHGPEPDRPVPLQETQAVVDRVRALMGGTS